MTVPRRFGEYELLEVIGRGGMGVVYRARHDRLNRVVALKMIRTGAWAGPVEIRRFLLEAEAAARLDHPNIVPVFEVGEIEGQHYFSMRLVEGGNLAQRCSEFQVPGSELATGNSKPETRNAKLMATVARAVHYAHERGILHRDLKPANILLDGQGEPLVADFGLAKLAHAEGDATLSGTAVGTPAYMAPEQAAGASAEHTTGSDVYSLGAILYHLLTGRPPFEAATPMETMRRLLQEEPVRPTALNPQLDRDLETICLKCLEKDSHRRYPSAAALADDLERWRRHEPIHARASTAFEKTVKWARRKPAQAALLGVSVIGLAAFIVVLLVGDVRLQRERNFAFKQKLAADRAATQAAAEARRAETNEFATRLNLYAADIFLAKRALDEGNLGVARRALAAHFPQPGQADLRGFEWRHFWRRSQGEQSHVLAGHTKPVTGLAFTRDGRRVVSAGRDGTIRFWNATNGALERLLPPPGLAPKSDDRAAMAALLAVSPEAVAAVATGQETLQGFVQRARPSVPGDLRALAVSPDGLRVAAGGEGTYVRVWNVTNQTVEFVIPARSTRTLAFAHDGRWLVVGDGGAPKLQEPGAVRIYDVATHQRVQTVENAPGVFALAEDGQTLALVKSNGVVELRDLRADRVVRSWRAPGAIHSMVFARDGKTVAALGSSRHEVWLWDAGSGALSGKWNTGEERLAAIAFSPDASQLASVGDDHAVRLWDVRTAEAVACWRGHGDELLAVAFGPAGDVVASGGKDLTVRLWPAENKPDPDIVAGVSSPMAMTPDGRCVVARTGNKRARIVDVTNGSGTEVPWAGTDECLAWGRDGTTFATVSRTGHEGGPQIEWHAVAGGRAGAVVPLAETPKDWKCAAISTAAGLCAVAHGRGQVVLFDLHSGAVVQRLGWRRRSISRLMFSPDGAQLAAYDWPGNFHLWRVANGAALSEWRVTEGVAQVWSYSPDGRLLASGGDDNLISVWDTASGRRVAALRWHKAEIKALAFAPDGRTLASASQDLTLKLWHVPTWRELGTAWRGAVFTFLAFGGEGPTLYAGEHRGTLHLLRAAADPVAENATSPPLVEP